MSWTEDAPTLVFGGLGHLPAARLLGLRFGPEPRAAVAALAPFAAFGPARPAGPVAQLALTPRGLGRLARPLALPHAFADPQGSDHHARVLGDLDDCAAATWAWSGDDLDLLALLYAADAAGLDALEAAAAAVATVGARLELTTLADKREHFGFADGLTDPLKEGVAPGEFVFGAPDEAGERPAGPGPLAEAGSYLVVRQLAQDVAAFWAAAAAHGDGDPVGLAARMIGRRPDGALLAERYADDPHGLAVPRGAHIRRANPRDAPGPGGPAARRHLLLRRGRPYGPPAPPAAFPPGLAPPVAAAGPAAGPSPAEAERGLLFVALNTDLSRQFEHVQQSWLNHAKFDGLHDEVCPISSGRGAPSDAGAFTVPGTPLRRRVRGWPKVVRVRGSAYALLLGRPGLRRLLDEPGWWG